MLDIVLAALAALAAGLVNAIAGGGSLITFPTLVALGVPPVAAAATNTVALCPGYFGAAVAQRRDLVGQRGRMLRLLPIAAAGGIGGALLLLATGEGAFAAIVPFLILLASALLGFQDAIKKRLVGDKPAHELATAIPVALAAVYGGYFGAGAGIMIVAALAIFLDDSLIRLNALKQTLTLVINVAAAVVFALSPATRWALVGPMAIGALAGGVIGGALASRIPARALRIAIVALGVAISTIYFIKLFAHL